METSMKHTVHPFRSSKQGQARCHTQGQQTVHRMSHGPPTRAELRSLPDQRCHGGNDRRLPSYGLAPGKMTVGGEKTVGRTETYCKSGQGATLCPWELPYLWLRKVRMRAMIPRMRIIASTRLAVLKNCAAACALRPESY